VVGVESGLVGVSPHPASHGTPQGEAQAQISSLPGNAQSLTAHITFITLTYITSLVNITSNPNPPNDSTTCRASLVSYQLSAKGTTLFASYLFIYFLINELYK
jgi:hypothetical protein